MVVGGFAVGYHGYPRYTGDLDIWINPTEENFRRLTEAVSAFGYDVHALKKRPIKDPRPIKLPNPPVKIDVLTFLSKDPDYTTYKSRANTMKLEGTTVPVIAYQDLIETKLATLRERDIEDIQMLEKIHKNNPDNA